VSTFEHDGETLWYDDRGSGVPLVALHGGLGLDHTYLRPALDGLGPGVRTIYLDLRANGRSTGDGVGTTMSQLAADVEALCVHLGLDRVAVLGHSYGGFVALQHALDHPDRVGHLLLCDTDSSGPTDDAVAAGMRRLGLDLDLLAAFESPMGTLEELLTVFDVVEPAYFPHSPAGTARAGLADTIPRDEGSAAGEAALDGWDVGARLAEITCPALVLHGADDFLFPSEGAELLAQRIPGARLRVFGASGHLPFVEEVDAFRDEVRAFLLGGADRH